MYLIFVALISLCGASDYELMALGNKKAEADYGERLSSIENPSIKRLRFSGRNSDQMTRSTRCSTLQPITMDPYYIPNDKQKVELSADTMNNTVTEESVPRRAYEPPPSAKNPDHYIDDD